MMMDVWKNKKDTILISNTDGFFQETKLPMIKMVISILLVGKTLLLKVREKESLLLMLNQVSANIKMF